MAENAVEEKKSRRRRRGEVEEAAVIEEEDAGGFTPGKGRVTPGRRNQEDVKEEGNVVTRPLLSLVDYFRDVRSELEKVNWPTREEAFRLTRVVMVTLVVAAAVMGSISFVFKEFIALGLNNPILFIALLVIAVGGALYVFRNQSSARSGY